MRKRGERGTGELGSGKEMILTCGSALSVRGGGARATQAEREREVCGPCRVSGAEIAGWTGPRALVWAGGKEREGLGLRWVLGPG